jgi:hypothetical protein
MYIVYIRQFQFQEQSGSSREFNNFVIVIHIWAIISLKFKTMVMTMVI